jgi:hypothetical protein
MPNESREYEKFCCRIRGCAEVTRVAPHTRIQGSTWVCRIHRAMLTASAIERAHLAELGSLIARQHLVLDAAGWLTPVPLKPPKPRPIAIDDDGFERFRDMSSPHGQTVRPEVDTLIGDDPRLDKYRATEDE